MRLRADKISCVRGGRRVFADLSLRVTTGGLLTLRGPNGSGKSTLLRAIAGLTPIERGGVWLDDQDLDNFRDALQESMLYVGHLDALKPGLSVLENLLFWANFYGADEFDAAKHAKSALERLDLAHLAERPAGYCSAGQRRRLGLGRLIAIDRPIWLLDEPTVALDSASIEVLGAAIDARRESGGIVVAATHQDLPSDGGGTLDVGDFAAGPEPSSDPFLSGDWTES